MMSPPTGGRPKVTGSSMATAAPVPMPGSTPTSVPTNAPSRTKPILYGFAATEKPSARLARRSVMGGPFRSKRPEMEGKLEQIDEQRDAERGHRHGGEQAFHPAHFGRSHDRNHEGDEGGQHQSERRYLPGKADRVQVDAADQAGKKQDGRRHIGRSLDRDVADRRPRNKQAGQRH